MNTTAKTYKTEIVIWSKIGHCPVTNRKGAYCDELLKEEIECDSPASAKARVKKLLTTVPNAAKGYFYIPAYPNQNMRTGWIS